jgi:hypothetical protein
LSFSDMIYGSKIVAKNGLFWLEIGKKPKNVIYKKVSVCFNRSDQLTIKI